MHTPNPIKLLLSFLFISSLSAKLFDRFENWAEKFNIRFHSESHLYEVLEKWITNDRFIDVINGRNLSYTLAHNQFSGMNERDFQQYIMQNGFLFNHPASDSGAKGSLHLGGYLPDQVDWVKKGAVTPVNDQGQCGSCWSFSAVGALEGAYAIQTGLVYDDIVSFSEQQLVDCDNLRNGGRDHGCNGGLMDNAFAWIGKNGGLCTEEDYPYISGNGGQTWIIDACNKTCVKVAGSDVQSYVDIMPSSDDAMMHALERQPVAVAIEADQREFQLYKSGVFTGTCGKNLDHGVLLVGYGTDRASGLDYYKVKNSWGKSWGQDGYILLARGKQVDGTAYNDGAGQCGVLLEGSFPVL